MEEKNIVYLSTDQVRNHPKNLRRKYGDLKELADSIKENGILQNLVVIPDPKQEGCYLAVIGNKRLRAAKQAGLETLPCVITEMDEQEVIETMLVENMNRGDLTLLEESRGVQMCLEDFGMSVADLSRKTGLSRTTIRRRRNIAKLDEDTVRSKLDDKSFNLTVTSLEALEKVKDVGTRNEILKEADSASNLEWRAAQAVEQETKEKNLKGYVALAEAEGIRAAENVTSSDIYYGKWETVKDFRLLKPAPDALWQEGEAADGKDGLSYIVQNGRFKLIRKKKKVKRELTPEELFQKDLRKARKAAKDMFSAMYDEMSAFVFGIIEGSVSGTETLESYVPTLWGVLTSKFANVGLNRISTFMTGKPTYEMDEKERETFYENAGNLPIPVQMLALALAECESTDFITDSGAYDDESVASLLEIYGCLHSYGFSFSSEDFDALLDGTHEVYGLAGDADGGVADTDAADTEATEYDASGEYAVQDGDGFSGETEAAVPEESGGWDEPEHAGPEGDPELPEGMPEAEEEAPLDMAA